MSEYYPKRPLAEEILSTIEKNAFLLAIKGDVEGELEAYKFLCIFLLRFDRIQDDKEFIKAVDLIEKPVIADWRASDKSPAQQKQLITIEKLRRAREAYKIFNKKFGKIGLGINKKTGEEIDIVRELPKHLRPKDPDAEFE